MHASYVKTLDGHSLNSNTNYVSFCTIVLSGWERFATMNACSHQQDYGIPGLPSASSEGKHPSDQEEIERRRARAQTCKAELYK